MLQYERRGQSGSTVIRDVVFHPADVAEDCSEILKQAGFFLCEELPGDADNNIPSLCSSLQETGGEDRIRQIGGRAALCLEVWSVDEETGIKVGFSGAHDITRNILYMKMKGEACADAVGMERPTKSCITSILDIADACRAKKLTIGLGVEQASSAEFLCSLLYLGFQVVPSRKSPLVNCALLLDLEIGWPAADIFSSTDGQCTGTSDCSTSADDDVHGVPLESDLSGAE